jgi:hypothetical protein
LYVIGWIAMVAMLPATWIVSEYRADSLWWVWSSGANVVLQSAGGELSFSFEHLTRAMEVQPIFLHLDQEMLPMEIDEFPAATLNYVLGSSLVQHQKWGFECSGSMESDKIIVLRAPYWALSTPVLLWAAYLLLGELKTRRRRRRGLCVQCGYDLRASPDRCPECGRVADESK